MNFMEFLNRVFLFFPPKVSEGLTIEEIYETYEKTLNIGKKYNYDNAFSDLMRTRLSSKTPTCGEIANVLDRNEICEEKPLVEKCIEFRTIIAYKKGHGNLEFGIEPGMTEEQARRNLIARGFSNIRLKY
jgi:hypothetical protein